MASPSRALRRIRLIHNLKPQQHRHASDFSHIQTSLPRRTISPIFSTLTPDPSYRLRTTLADFLPNSDPPLTLPSTSSNLELPPAHHLLYFEPTKKSSEMLPDGTNPDHFPGEPFVRRMWAGGKIIWNHHARKGSTMRLDGGVGVCAEFIRDVTIKGGEGEEKVFVEIERRIARADRQEVEMLGEAWRDEKVKRDLEHLVRQRLWRDGEEDFGVCGIIERRGIVFLRAQPEQKAAAGKTAEKKPSTTTRILKPEHSNPDFTHSLTPDAKLLFRFSALTFNAHAIHLDPHYTLHTEGHRALLVQGPLILTLLVTLLSNHLGKEGNQVIKSIEYRNLAPIYVGEEARFCGKRVGEKKWEVWVEGPEGGVKVRGRVGVEEGVVDRSDLGV